MKKLLLVFLLMCVGSVSAGPIIIGGGGVSEYSLVFARGHLAELISMCNDCRSSSDQEFRKAVKEVVRSTVQAPVAVFSNSAELGLKLFEVRGGEVLFNQDLLWLDQQQSMPYDIANATALWIDVLASINTFSSTQITTLKRELTDVLLSKMIRSTAFVDLKNSFESMIWKQSVILDRIFVRDAAFTSIELTSTVLALTQCLTIAPQIQFHNARWASVTSNADNSLSLGLDIIQSTKCGAKASRSRVKITMRAIFDVDKAVYAVDPNSIRAFLEGE